MRQKEVYLYRILGQTFGKDEFVGPMMPKDIAKRREKEIANKALRLAKSKKRLDVKCMDIYGITYDEYVNIKGNIRGTSSPTHRYLRQKANAIKRGIEWQLSLSEWWDIWQSSGKWDKRGRCYGEYVMARHNDEGPYSKDNVKIILNSENIIEYYENEYGNDYTETLIKARRYANSAL